MAYHKQPDLNGAYYGPPIPPRSHHRPSRGGGCGCCLFNCLSDCGCCLLSCIFKLLCSILFIIALILVILYFLLRPHEIKFHVTTANLTAFNLTDNHRINYNLAVNFTVRNPNDHVSIYYDQIQANVIYADQRISSFDVERFFQGDKNTTSFGPVLFKGQNQAFLIKDDDKFEFDKENNEGVYEIVVKLNLRVRFKIGWFKFGTYKPKVKCDLKVPLEGKSKAKFEETRCHYSL